jgi:hypothetical protein
MLSLKNKRIINNDFLCIKSEICGLASVYSKQEKSELNEFVKNLIYSYFNNYKQALFAYEIIYELVDRIKLFESTDLENLKLLFKDVDNAIIITDYTHLFILKMKSSLDLLACLIEYLLKRSDFEINEYSLTDIGKLKTNDDNITRIICDFKKNETIKELIENRNRLSHRGYLIQSTINNTSTIELSQKIEHGINISSRYDFNISIFLTDYIDLLSNFEKNITKNINTNDGIVPIANGYFNDYVNKYELP